MEPDPTIEMLIAGALFDFAGSLTGGDTLTVGRSHLAPPVVERLQAWAQERHLNLGEARVRDWEEAIKPPVPAAREEPDLTSERPSFADELETLLNIHSQENASDTPDFILAPYLQSCLDALGATIKARDKWYGIQPEPGVIDHKQDDQGFVRVPAWGAEPVIPTVVAAEAAQEE